MELTDKRVGELTVQVSPQLEALGVPHGFTTRMGGVSTGIFASLNLGCNRGDDPDRVRENYRRVCAALGVEMESLVFTSQVHGDAVRTVTATDRGTGLDRRTDYEADGLITNVPGVTLVAFGADCLTVMLYDPVKRVVANVHAGWRGTALGIVERAVEKMKNDYGCDPANVVAAIGPGISKCCFETDADVPEAMEKALGDEATKYVTPSGNGKYHVDLKGLNALRLRRCGVLTTRIDISPDCTVCRHDRYWSHRYTKGERGSQAALIALPEEEL